jgi:hypothetical protein
LQVRYDEDFAACLINTTESLTICKQVTVDGAMLASKDFGFMLTQGLATMVMQLVLLKTWCSNLSDIFATFTLRLGSYAVISLIRAALGYGKLGRAIFSSSTKSSENTAATGATSIPM